MLKPQQLFLVREPVDMRRGIDALTQHLEGLNLRWQEEAAFVFCNKARSRLKVLPGGIFGPLCTGAIRN
ncbi:IS66 family insertion sequence element accessory protein TnpB [Photorhabdus khanii]|uniref:IS66 family insertion sequence element accessory protein TnpB n=1 Tax=Photorhabdus khanii TaxID=1004150 RepID=UPI003BB7EF5D